MIASDPQAQARNVVRCPSMMAGLCDKKMPALVEIEPGHLARCFLHSQETEPQDEWTNI